MNFLDVVLPVFGKESVGFDEIKTGLAVLENIEGPVVRGNEDANSAATWFPSGSPKLNIVADGRETVLGPINGALNGQ